MSRVTVRYPFHPLYGQTLEIASKARHADGSHTVVAPDGAQLKIAAWMTVPEAEARALLIEAFLAETIPATLPEDLNGELRENIRAWLAEARS